MWQQPELLGKHLLKGPYRSPSPRSGLARFQEALGGKLCFGNWSFPLAEEGIFVDQCDLAAPGLGCCISMSAHKAVGMAFL